MTELRVCKSCGESKPLSEYGTDKRELRRGGIGKNIYCKVCTKAQSKATRDKSPERRREIKMKYRHSNPEEVKRSTRAQRAKKPEEYNQAARELYRKNKGKVLEQSKAAKQRRDFLLKNAEGSYSKDDLSRLLVEQDSKCAYCETDISVKRHTDHKTPLFRGGSNWPSNIHLVCPTCNSKKYILTHEEFLHRLDADLI